MRQVSQHYHAFISYRHNDRDKMIAAELQKRLEKYKIVNPQTGKMEWITVFRDQSELPTSDDLGKDIETALEASDYLVIICSRDYQKSVWCMRELAYFMSLHGGSSERILPVLTEGEPEECFPSEICVRKEIIQDEKAGSARTVTVPVEPMAADVRGSTLHERLKKLRSTECMRIAAPILGVTFDTLYQRKARARFKKISAAVSAVLALAIGFGVYNFSVNQKLTIQQQELLKSDSKNLAFTAQLLAQEGKRIDALQTLLRAFPTETQPRPIVSEAEQALHQLMYTYQEPRYRSNRVYQGYDDIAQSVLSEDGRFLVTVDYGKNIVCYDLLEDKEVWRNLASFDSFQIMRHPKLQLIPGVDAVLLTQATDIQKISISTGTIDWKLDVGFTSIFTPILSPDGKYIAVCRQDSYDAEKGAPTFFVYFYDTRTGKVSETTGELCYTPGQVFEQNRDCHSFNLGASGFSEDDRFFTLTVDHSPEELCMSDFIELAVYDLAKAQPCNYYTTRADTSASKCEISERQNIEVFPVLDISGVSRGFLYRIKSSDNILYSGTIFQDSKEETFQASFQGLYGYSPIYSDGIGVFRTEDNVLFVCNEGAAQLCLSDFSWQNTSFQEKCIQCFKEEDQIFLFFENGEFAPIQSNSLSINDAQKEKLTNNTCRFAAKPVNGNLVIIPDSSPTSALIYSKIGDTTGEKIYLEATNTPGNGSAVVPLSASKVLIISYGDQLHGSLLDTQSMLIHTQSVDSPTNKECQGINANGDMVVLGSYIWDLSTNTITESSELSWQSRNLEGLSFLAIGNSILPAGYSQEANTASTLQWWNNGVCVDVPMEYQGMPIVDGIVFSMKAYQEDAFLIGKNGLLAAKMGFGEIIPEEEYYALPGTGRYSGLMVFSAQDKIWRYVPSGTDAYYPRDYLVPYCAFAQYHQQLGLIEQDGALRIYDWDQDTYIYQYDLQIPYTSVHYMSFFGDDKYALICTDEKILIVELETGTLLLDEIITTSINQDSGSNYGYSGYCCIESENHLAIILDSESADGFCVNTDNWEIEHRIPGLRYMNKDAAVVSVSGGKQLVLYPNWKTEDLITAAEQELSQYTK